MSGDNSTTVTEAQQKKANKEKYGQMGGPITGAVKVFKKVQDHDFGGKKGVSWAIETGEGKLIKATTYDGNLGAKFNLGDHNTQPAPAADSKDRRRALKGYDEVSVDECPIATA